MAPPSWLPPLNLHNTYDIYVKASQPFEAGYDPSLSSPVFDIKIKVCVNFYSDNDGEGFFEGLSMEADFGTYCHQLTSNRICFHDKLCLMLEAMQIPFDFDGAVWRERQLNSSYMEEASRTCCKLFDNCNLIEKIAEFLLAMKSQEHNARKNRLPFKLEIEKMVTIPSQQLRAWKSWYDEKKRVGPEFERDFQEAIGRPRTFEEELYETTLAFRGAKISSIQELEEVTMLDDSISRSNCPIC